MKGDGGDQDTMQSLLKIRQHRINAKTEKVHAGQVPLAQRHPDVSDSFTRDVVDHNHRDVILVQVPESGSDTLVQPLLLQHHESPVQTNVVKSCNEICIKDTTAISSRFSSNMDSISGKVDSMMDPPVVSSYQL